MFPGPLSADELSIMRQPPTSLSIPISPPLVPLSKLPRAPSYPGGQTKNDAEAAKLQRAPSLADIEVGEAKIKDHLKFISEHLARVTRSSAPGPCLSNAEFVDIYQRNQHNHGHHFVVHQHDHPVAGVHYDLRLQISKSSSISFAIMYGLPGNPNSTRLSRNATETRVHNIWSHLIESASLLTGSLLIWDTGEYSVLPHRPPSKETDDELSSESEEDNKQNRTSLSGSAKLHQAFQDRKIRLRLHGTRLPPNYTITLRLHDINNRHEQPKKPSRKRRRKDPESKSRGRKETPPSSDLEEEPLSLANGIATPSAATPPVSEAFERELQEIEDEEVRQTNAYPGASNTINSIHQRQWYITLDRSSSGFVRKRNKESGGKIWVRRKREGGALVGFETFFVRGRDVERSVVTGRTADEVMADEGVEGFVGRKGWRAVLE
ncbi:MAG: hypothetical protein FRX48_05900 [Lasallia pustulata]|uniref:DNA ligase D 3'-phosphoesterase domain-containing protein n=1 Tax=Lasallia pustulata TaxID=136370 RepID=A0A5M8PNB1_9LECA|nr:MAG: hypothetical protein FRX48_05900 [Lasallia pustulata]